MGTSFGNQQRKVVIYKIKATTLAYCKAYREKSKI